MRVNIYLSRTLTIPELMAEHRDLLRGLLGVQVHRGLRALRLEHQYLDWGERVRLVLGGTSSLVLFLLMRRRRLMVREEKHELALEQDNLLGIFCFHDIQVRAI